MTTKAPNTDVTVVSGPTSPGTHRLGTLLRPPRAHEAQVPPRPARGYWSCSSRTPRLGQNPGGLGGSIRWPVAPRAHPPARRGVGAAEFVAYFLSLVDDSPDWSPHIPSTSS